MSQAKPPEMRATQTGAIFAETLLGEGHEGTVWTVKDHQYLAVKVFHGGLMPARTKAKLLVMMSQAPTTRCRAYRIAWPLELTSEKGKRTSTGYLMPRLDQEQHREIGAYFNRMRRDRRIAQRGKGYSMIHMLTIARNLAQLADTLHERRIIIGDLSSRNVRANDHGQVALIDVDSMQVTDTDGQVYRCTVGTPEYCAPERQGMIFDKIDKTTADDEFALAVMIYQLIFQGRHPFAGIPTLNQTEPESASIQERIRKGQLIHDDAESGYQPTRPDSIIWAATPFKRQFRAGLARTPPRYTAKQWMQDIDRTAERLKQCPANPGHQYFGNRACTWCRYQKATGRDPFRQTPPVEQHKPRKK